MAPLILGALSLLPQLPEMWNSVASIFGSSVPKTVKDAGDLASTVLSAFQKGEVPPDVQLKLEAEVNRHKERIEELALQKIKEDHDYQIKQEELINKNAADVLELNKIEAQSNDEYVRRTRPEILRNLFKISAIYIFYAPLCVIAAYSIGLPAVAITAFIDMVLSISSWLFGTFTAAFLGYAAARTVDKYKKGNVNDGVSGKLVNTLLKLK